MSQCIICPFCGKFGRLAFDGYFTCPACRTYLPKESFIRALHTLDSQFAKRRDAIAELIERKELNG